MAAAKTRVARATKRLLERPHKKNLEYWTGVRKGTESVLIQARTGIIGLASYLYIINAADSLWCSCSPGAKVRLDPKHVLLSCPRFAEQRAVLRADLDRLGVAMRGSTNDMLSSLPASVKVAQFLFDTGLLGQFQHIDGEAIGWEPVDSSGAQHPPTFSPAMGQ